MPSATEVPAKEAAPKGMPRLEPTAAGLVHSRLGRGLMWFFLLSAGGLGVLFAFTFKGHASAVVGSLSPTFLALAAVGAVMDLLIGAVRYQIFLRRIRPGTRLWLPIKADLANRFVGAVTPSQTGGGPAQVFILARGGIPIPDALSFLLINFISTLLFFLLAGGFSVWVFQGRFSGSSIRLLVEYGFAAFGVCLVIMMVGLFRPDLLARLLEAVARRLRPMSDRWWARMLAAGCETVASTVDQYRVACTRFIRESPLLPVASFVLTVVLYLNKFTLAWLLMRGLGVHASYVTTIALQALLQFILYVAPSPGGSGIAELSTGAVMALLMPPELLAPFTLAFRFFLLYLPAAVGAFVLMAELRPRARARSVPQRVRKGEAGRSAARATAVGLALLLGGVAHGEGQATRPVHAPAVQPVHALTVRPLHTPADAEALVVRGLLTPEREAADSMFAQAVTVARTAVMTAPDDAEAHYALAVALGYALQHQGLRTKFRLTAEVRREAERTLELDSLHAGAHHVLGRLNAAAMRLNPIARVIARKILGASVLEGASWKEAEHHFTLARRLEPRNPRHAMELGALYIDTHRPELARAVLEDALTLPAVAPQDSLAVVRARVLLAEVPQS